MAAKKAQETPSDTEKKSTKYQVAIDEDMVWKLKMVASSRKITAPNYINTTLRAVLEHDFPKALRDLGLPPESDDQKNPNGSKR